jgi:prevent-host-death family protein
MGIRELRDSLTQAIRRVRAGETIEVTHDGEPVALLVPVPAHGVDRLIAEGRATPPRRRLVLPEARESESGLTTAQILDELRDDRL